MDPSRVKNKQIRAMIKTMVADGWVLVRFSRGAHPVMRAPNGRQMTLPSTPGDHRALHNAKALARRLAQAGPIAADYSPKGSSSPNAE